MRTIDDKVIARALDDDAFLVEARTLADVETRIVDALITSEDGADRPTCIEAMRAPVGDAKGYLEAWFRIRASVHVPTRNESGMVTRITAVSVDVRLGFVRPCLVEVASARIGSRTLARDTLARVFPSVAVWRPRVPALWYALALLRESPPNGLCGTCLSEPYTSCACPREGTS